jgi:hypothetical protein
MDIPVFISSSLSGQRARLEACITDAAHRLVGFARKYRWENLLAVPLVRETYIFDNQKEFIRKLLAVTGTISPATLPSTVSAALENQLLLAISPELYARIYPEGIETHSYEKLLTHEMAHRLHIRILDGNEEAMGPVWFFEGFALFAAGQFESSPEKMNAAEMIRIIQTPVRGSYEKYAILFRQLLEYRSLEKLIDASSSSNFTEQVIGLIQKGAM